MTCQAHPALVKKGESDVRFVPFNFFFYLSGYLACLLLTPQVGGSPVGLDGPKDPWPRVLSLPVGDPASRARDNILAWIL